ncbi:MAG: response regulator [Chloroflexi bacterium]|jgi:CheY-like chemotaxis protein|nr:response regulator [Chloroflexota bacterium]
MEKKRILIADDEPNIRAVVARMLDKDYIVLEAANGKEAVDIAGRERPDIILMDLMMPEMDGYTACSLIKADQATKMIPVIILTAIGHEFNRKFAMEMGADAYVTKPFTPQVLADAIGPLLGKAL